MNYKKRAKLVAFEGIDGSGKGLQFGKLYEALMAEGAKVGKMDFPAYDCFFGKEIGRLLSGDSEVNAGTVDVKSMSLWYAMDRYMAFQNMDLEDYDYVLLNRSTLSNAVYQSVRCPVEERKDMMTWIEELEFTQLGIPKPDLFIVFDIPTSQSERNVAKKGHRDYVGEKADVYEADKSFMGNVRQGYLDAANIFQNVAVLDCMDGDDMLPIEVISNKVLEIVKSSHS